MSELITGGVDAVEAKLAAEGADQIRNTAPAPDTGTPETVTDEAPARIRDEQGRFAAQDEPATDVQPEDETPAPAEAEQQTGDPAVAAVLAKYGGDVDKALSAYVHLQRKAGQQSTELGDLRRMVDELSQIKESIVESNAPRQAPIDQATVDWFDEQIMENPKAALEWARNQGNDLLVQRGTALWKQTDPYGAIEFAQEERLRELEQKIQRAQQLPMDATVHMALQSVKGRNPEFVNYDDAIQTTLAQHPGAAKAVERAAESGDPQELEAAIETLYSLAIGDTLRSLALSGPAPDTGTTTTDVVTPSTSETYDPAPEPSGQDLFKQQFQQEAERVRKGVWVES